MDRKLLAVTIVLACVASCLARPKWGDAPRHGEVVGQGAQRGSHGPAWTAWTSDDSHDDGRTGSSGWNSRGNHNSGSNPHSNDPWDSGVNQNSGSSYGQSSGSSYGQNAGNTNPWNSGVNQGRNSGSTVESSRHHNDDQHRVGADSTWDSVSENGRTGWSTGRPAGQARQVVVVGRSGSPAVSTRGHHADTNSQWHSGSAGQQHPNGRPRQGATVPAPHQDRHHEQDDLYGRREY